MVYVGKSISDDRRGGSGVSTSVEKDPFTETIEIANLSQYSPIYTQTGVLNLIKGAASTFINGEYTVPINTNGDDINKSSDLVWLYNDYTGQSSLFYLSTKLLPDGKIGLFMVNSQESAVAPVLMSANTDPDGNKVFLTFSVAMADPAGKESEFSVSGGKTITSVQLNATDTKIIELLIDTPYVPADVITASYTKGTVVSSDLVALESFTNESVTNDVLDITPSYTFRPQFSTSYAVPNPLLFPTNDSIEIEIDVDLGDDGGVPYLNKRLCGMVTPASGQFLQQGVLLEILSSGNYGYYFGESGVVDTLVAAPTGRHTIILNKDGLFEDGLEVWSSPGYNFDYNTDNPESLWLCTLNNGGSENRTATQYEFYSIKIRRDGELIAFYTARSNGDGTLIDNITSNIITPNANMVVTAIP